MSKQHRHRCMRCNEEFECQSVGTCTANYNVLPTIVTAGPCGIEMREHCPASPSWDWIREYAQRSALEGWKQGMERAIEVAHTFTQGEPASGCPGPLYWAGLIACAKAIEAALRAEAQKLCPAELGGEPEVKP